MRLGRVTITAFLGQRRQLCRLLYKADTVKVVAPEQLLLDAAREKKKSIRQMNEIPRICIRMVMQEMSSVENTTELEKLFKFKFKRREEKIKKADYTDLM